MTITVIENPQFPEIQNDSSSRPAGISAFLRVKNGEDYLESAIRSHIDCFDEIVAVFNNCTDKTPDILSQLSVEFGEKLRVFNYIPEVYPPGSNNHSVEPASSPHSLVHYYNFTLAQTRYSVVTKLDDDHIALKAPLEKLCQKIRNHGCKLPEVWCFSGLNLARRKDGTLGIPMADPISGNGDIGFFTPTSKTVFIHDHRFERFNNGGIPRRFCGFLYWHMKYLKNDAGFANYELKKYPDSRYQKKKAKFQTSTILPLPLFRAQILRKQGIMSTITSRLNPKFRLRVERDAAVALNFPHVSLRDAILETSPDFAEQILHLNSEHEAKETSIS